jgi:hypothetical protein
MHDERPTGRDAASPEPAREPASDEGARNERAPMGRGSADVLASPRSASLVSVREPPRDALFGSSEPLASNEVMVIADALLKAPASVLSALRERGGVTLRLVAILITSLAVTGVVMATFSGGPQLLLVPAKLTLGTLLCAMICLPSLHVFSCLSGAEQSVKETWGALMMGVTLMGVLLVGFAPVLWVFGQATNSVPLMGALHLFFFVVSAAFGLGLSLRALSAMNRAPIRAGGLWSVMFVCVLLQMSTTLRPLVGPFDGVLFHERTFFLAHWFGALAS